MALQAGDEVTLSIQPTIRISKYNAVRPHASLRRTLGDNPTNDLAAMRADLRVLLLDALKVELGLLNDAYDAIGELARAEGVDELTVEKLAEILIRKVPDESAERLKEAGGTAGKRAGQGQAKASAPQDGNDQLRRPKPAPRPR